MPQETWSGPLGEIRSASTAGGGTALTTAATLIQIPDGAYHLFLTSRNFAGAAVVKFAVNPYLVVFKTTDALATVANQTDYSDNAQDASTSTLVTLSALNTAASNNYVYVGSHLPFRGVVVTVVGANSNAATLTVKYWNGSAWTDTSASDGTASGGDTFAVTGSVTWTVPTDWTKASLATINSPAVGVPGIKYSGSDAGFYWTRWEVSAQLSATVTASSMLALNRNTANYAELLSGQTLAERFSKGPGHASCVEALTDNGTASLIVNVATSGSDRGFK